MSKPMNRDLRAQTPGELLWLWRNHHGLTLRRAAAQLGLGRNKYEEMEGGGTPIDGWRQVLALSLKLDPRDILTPGLLCKLARRRWAGEVLSLASVAGVVGVSKVALLRWEDIGAPRLVAFWQSKGFVFPAGTPSAKDLQGGSESSPGQEPIRPTREGAGRGSDGHLKAKSRGRGRAAARAVTTLLLAGLMTGCASSPDPLGVGGMLARCLVRQESPAPFVPPWWACR